MAAILNLAFYRFFPFPNGPALREPLKSLALECGLRGTVLLSPEGVNGFVAGPEAGARRFLREFEARLGGLSLEAKESWSEEIPFRRMLVKLKREIIPMGERAIEKGIDPLRETARRLEPEELKRWLDEGRPVTLLDTRNDFEIGVGTFRGAKTLNLNTFREFPDRLQGALKEKAFGPAESSAPVVMFCTGGIRCEKAGAYGMALGMREVYQLEGGILKYFEKCGESHYDGECFVFDQRVALTPELKPSVKHAVCFACRKPLTSEDLQSPLYQYEKQCPGCANVRRED